MSYQNISYVMPAADVLEIKKALDVINSKLPFLINLKEDEKKDLFKMGPKSVDFVQDAALVVEQYPNIFPTNFNAPEFTKDAALLKALIQINIQLDSLQEKVHDTVMAVGSEAMASALQAYSYVQTGAKTTPGLKSVEEKLSERFKGQGRRKVSVKIEPVAQ